MVPHAFFLSTLLMVTSEGTQSACIVTRNLEQATSLISSNDSDGATSLMQVGLVIQDHILTEHSANATEQDSFWRLNALKLSTVAVTLVYLGYLYWKYHQSNESDRPETNAIDRDTNKQSDPTEPQLLRTWAFGGPVLTLAVLMFAGFLPAAVTLLPNWQLLQEEWLGNAGHGILACLWLFLSFFQVSTGVLGSQSPNAAWRPWHRGIGYVAVFCGIYVGTSGWALTRAPTFPSPGFSMVLLIEGLSIVCNIVAGLVTIIRKQYTEHKVFMSLAVAWTCHVGSSRLCIYILDILLGCYSKHFDKQKLLLAPPAKNFETTISLLVCGVPLLWFIKLGEVTRRIVIFNLPPALLCILVDVRAVYEDGFCA